MIANFIPFAISGILLGMTVENKGAKMYFAVLGAILLILGHVLNLVLPICGAVDNKDWEEAACWTAYLPIVLSAVGQAVYPVILLSSLTYFAVHQVQGMAFGIAISASTATYLFFAVLFDLIFQPKLDISTLSLTDIGN